MSNLTVLMKMPEICPPARRNIPEPNLTPIDFFPSAYACQFQNSGTQQPKEEYPPNNLKWCVYQFLHALLLIILLVVVFYAYNQSVALYYATKQTPVCSISEHDFNYNVEVDSGDDVARLKREIDKLREQVGSLLIFQAMAEKQLTENDNKLTPKLVESKIESALRTFEADGIGLIDYASKLAGGSIISTPNTDAISTNQTVKFFSIFNLDVKSRPDKILDPDNSIGNCFAFCGSQGTIRIKLGKSVVINAVTMDHAPFVILEDVSHTPREFVVYGLLRPYDEFGIHLGSFEFKTNGKHFQTFPIEPSNVGRFEYVELKILSNHGNPKYTCLYRFRVHSIPN